MTEPASVAHLSPMTIYALKGRFQAVLRPLVRRMAAAGVSANQVTVAACVLSVVAGAALAWGAEGRGIFLLLPLVLLVRMGMNAADGMLAREFGHKSPLGAYLNELCDVVSDAALYAPLALVQPFAPTWVAAVVLLAALSEFAGVLGPMVGASRRYDGPMGKSDRAFVFGALGLWIGLGGPLPEWTGWLMPALAALVVVTVVNRVRNGLAEAGKAR